MQSREEVIQALRVALPRLASEYGVKRIGLFGSFARGTQERDSDIDLLVEFERPIGLKFVELAESLEELLGHKTDVLTPDGLKGIRVERVASDIQESVLYV